MVLSGIVGLVMGVGLVFSSFFYNQQGGSECGTGVWVKEKKNGVDGYGTKSTEQTNKKKMFNDEK